MRDRVRRRNRYCDARRDEGRNRGIDWQGSYLPQLHHKHGREAMEGYEEAGGEGRVTVGGREKQGERQEKVG